MDSFSRDDRERHLITRGNVDGIVSAALFLSAFPRSRISFVTSPTAGARILAQDLSSSVIFLSDLALIPELVCAIGAAADRTEIVAIDHHQTMGGGMVPDGTVVVREGMSAAAVLYQHLGLNGHVRKLVAVADLVEFCDTPLLREQTTYYGMRKLEEEARVLDFSWRLNIEDDQFRTQASTHLSRGIWPSEVGLIKRRYLQVMNEQRWPKALARVRNNMEIRAGTCLLDCKDKNRSLYGFGTRALVEVARNEGCQYAVMVNERKLHSSVSMRGLRQDGVNLGRFVSEFTDEHGLEGGGHPTSAGARIPVEMTDIFVDEFITLSSR
jgi:oligoribonuclease NrnB/cAMP/cGMP phosphodiesterase (DHH superfamily)